MKLLIIILTFVLFISLKAPMEEHGNVLSPLHDYSTEWDQPKYQLCNTAKNVAYLSAEEKNIFWILNMARMNPALFDETVVKQFPQLGDQPWLINIDEYKSLLETMRKIKPMQVLYPDSLCWVSAGCHASSAGNTGYVGHVRQNGRMSKEKSIFMVSVAIMATTMRSILSCTC
jgi:hypothetical protein